MTSQSRTVYCIGCGEDYDVSSIRWIDDQGNVGEPNPAYGADVLTEELRMKQNRWFALRLQPQCIKGDLLPEAVGNVPWLGVALVGETGSGKTSFVRSLRRELKNGSAAAAFGISGQLASSSEGLWKRRYGTDEPTRRPDPGPRPVYQPVIFELHDDRNSKHMANILIWDPAGELTKSEALLAENMPALGAAQSRVLFVPPGAVESAPGLNLETEEHATAEETERIMRALAKFQARPTSQEEVNTTLVVLSKADCYGASSGFPKHVLIPRSYADGARFDVLDDLIADSVDLHDFLVGWAQAQWLINAAKKLGSPYFVAVSGTAMIIGTNGSRSRGINEPVGVMDPLIIALARAGLLPETPTGRAA
jgi:hypothetical protein